MCDCANKTATAGYLYFGIQFWAECWAGENLDVAYDSDGQSDSCVDGKFLPCDSNAASTCAGVEDVNYVYEIKMDQSSDGKKKHLNLMVINEMVDFCIFKRMILLTLFLHVPNLIPI